jgi:hypothetical protein
MKRTILLFTSLLLANAVYADQSSSQTTEQRMDIELKPGLYKHSKSGKLYQVISVARHSETLEPLVVYQSLYGSYGMWCRPAAMFVEKVAIDGNKKKKRFVYLGAGINELPQLR